MGLLYLYLISAWVEDLNFINCVINSWRAAASILGENLRDPGVDGRIILRWKWYVGVWTETGSG
jgi:hypothetical protein